MARDQTTQWRNQINWIAETLEELTQYVVAYKPLKNLDVPQTRILLMGQVGAGKSSVFNTINSVFRGYVTAQANSGCTEHSLTTVYRMYQIRNGKEGKPLKFRLCDTRGIEEDQGMDANEIGYILDGHVPDKYEFNPSIPLSPDDFGWMECPKLADKIHCVAFVIDGSTVDVMPEKVLERIKRLQIRMNQRGIPQVVLLTKIDKVCEKVSENLSCVFSSRAVQDCVGKTSMMMGLPRSRILPFKNYESEVKLSMDVNILALISLKKILRLADDYMHNYLDDIKFSSLINVFTFKHLVLVVCFAPDFVVFVLV